MDIDFVDVCQETAAFLNQNKNESIVSYLKLKDIQSKLIRGEYSTVRCEPTWENRRVMYLDFIGMNFESRTPKFWDELEEVFSNIQFTRSQLDEIRNYVVSEFRCVINDESKDYFGISPRTLMEIFFRYYEIMNKVIDHVDCSIDKDDNVTFFYSERAVSSKDPYEDDE